MIWVLSMRGEDEGLTICRAGRMIQTVLWGIRGKYIRKKHRGSCLNKRPKIHGFLLRWLDKKEAKETSDSTLFKELVLFKPPGLSLHRVNRILLSALNLTLPRLKKLYLNKNPVKQIFPKASTEQSDWDPKRRSTHVLWSCDVTVQCSSQSNAHKSVWHQGCQGWAGKTQHIQQETRGDTQGSGSGEFALKQSHFSSYNFPFYATKRHTRPHKTCREFAHVSVSILCCFYCRFFPCGR